MARVDLLFRIDAAQGRTLEILDAVQKELREVGDEARRTGKKTKQGTDEAQSSLASFTSFAGGGFKSAMISVGAAVAGAFAARAVVDFAKDSIAAMRESEDATNRLRSALDSQGAASDENVAAFQRYNSALQKKSRYEDDSIASSQAIAMQLGVGADQMESFTQASIDMATALQIDLNSAMEQLAMTMSGDIGRLGRRVAALKDLTEAELRAGDAIEVVGAKFRGAAERDISTFSGSLDQLKNTLGDVKEEIGFGLVEGFGAAMGAAGGAAGAMHEFRAAVERATPGIKVWASQVSEFLVGAIKKAVEWSKELLSLLEQLSGAGATVTMGPLIKDLDVGKQRIDALQETLSLVSMKTTGFGGRPTLSEGAPADTYEQIDKAKDKLVELGFRSEDLVMATSDDILRMLIAEQNLVEKQEAILADRQSSAEMGPPAAPGGATGLGLDEAGTEAAKKWREEQARINAEMKARKDAAEAAGKAKKEEYDARPVLEVLAAVQGLNVSEAERKVLLEGLQKSAEQHRDSLWKAYNDGKLSLEEYQSKLTLARGDIEAVTDALGKQRHEALVASDALTKSASEMEQGTLAEQATRLDAVKKQAEEVRTAVKKAFEDGKVSSDEQAAAILGVEEALSLVKERAQSLFDERIRVSVDLLMGDQAHLTDKERGPALAGLQGEVDSASQDLLTQLASGSIDMEGFNARKDELLAASEEIQAAIDEIRLRSQGEEGEEARDLFGFVLTEDQMGVWREQQEELLAGTTTAAEVLDALKEAQIGVNEAVEDYLKKGERSALQTQILKSGLEATKNVMKQVATESFRMAIAGELSAKKMKQAALEALAEIAQQEAMKWFAKGLGYAAEMSWGQAALAFGAAAAWGLVANFAGKQASKGSAGGGGGGGGTEASSARSNAAASDTEASAPGRSTIINVHGALVGTTEERLARHIRTFDEQTEDEAGGRAGTRRRG